MAVADGIELSRDGVVRWRAPRIGDDQNGEAVVRPQSQQQPRRTVQKAPLPSAEARAQPAGAGLGQSQGKAEPESAGGMLTAGQVEQWESESRAEGRKQGLEEGRKEGLAEGFEKGLEEGRAEGLKEQRKVAKDLEAILQQLGDPIKGLEQSLEREILSLAVAMAQQLVRREIQIEPGEIIPVITEALGLLPSTANEVVVFVHPEDAVLIQGVLKEPGEASGWRLSEDPLLSRGGCRVESQNSSVDASVESRLAALMATHLGGLRHGD